MMKRVTLLAWLLTLATILAAKENTSMKIVNPIATKACKSTIIKFKNTTDSLRKNCVFVWKFGDGVVDTVNKLDTVTVYHTYGKDGQFTPELSQFDTLKRMMLERSASVQKITVYRPVAGFTSEPDVFMTYGITFALDKNIKPFNSSVWIYDWDFGDGESGRIEQDSSREIFHRYAKENTKPGYKVTLWARLNMPADPPLTEAAIKNCYDSVTVSVKVSDGFFTGEGKDSSSQIPNIPNLFTPNGDGVNDEFSFSAGDTLVDDSTTSNMIKSDAMFYFKTSGVHHFKFWVYNRWGGLVYKTEGPCIVWQGKNNSGDDLQSGLYFYVVESNAGDKRHNKSGFVHLVRE